MINNTPIIIVGFLVIIMLLLTLLVIPVDFCIDGSHWFMDRNDPSNPFDDYPFGPMIGNCNG
jgi:hypothetical protein